MGQISEKFSEETIHKMKQFYEEVIESPPQGAIFRARTNNAVITGYKSGKVLFQGANPEVEFERWSERKEITNDQRDARNVFSVKNDPTYMPPESLFDNNHIGSDESGTGDYFGPITTCTVFVTKQQIPWLREIGIQDSKAITDERVKELAKTLIAAELPYSLMVLRNERYNELQRRGWSQGKMKAMLHHAVIEKLMERVDRANVNGIIIDQFCNPDVYIKHIATEGKSLFDKTFFMTKAESYSIAVAAASIIARASFLNEMDHLSQIAGVELLKGASNEVDRVAAKVIRSKGETMLQKIAKVHFANTKKAKNYLK